MHSAAMFRALFETAPDAMVVVDRQARIVLANPQAVALFGYVGDELLGQAIEILLPESIRGGHVAHRERYMQNPRVRPMGQNLELVGRRRDGARFPLEIALSPIHTELGQFYAASIRDVSETQRVRQALARARFDAVLAQAGQLALESRLDATLEQLPQLVADALGVAGVAILFFQGKRRAAQVRASCALSDADLAALCVVLPSSAGASQADAIALPAAGWQSGMAAPLFDRDHAMGLLVALSRGVHDFDRDSVHFLQSIANLLAVVVQRNRSEEQLAHAQRLEAVGQLTGGIAHDFNNLLTIISGNLQLLEAETEHLPDAAHAISRALRAVGRGAELTRKLLAFAGRQPLNPQAVDPRQLLAELGEMLTRTLGEQIVIQLECGADVPLVYADPAQLEGALLNLALNARDAMPRGGTLRIAVDQVRVDAAPGSELRAGLYVSFVVQDGGIGMAPDTLARALEPFFTTKPPGKGSGLGLSMVYGFVTQSRGQLSVESQLGFGTRICLYLPAASGSALPLVAAAHTAYAASGRESVLVVEDEPEVRALALTFLRSMGYAVYVAAAADEALLLMDRHPEISLLFSDVILGAGMTGDELARELRRRHPALAVLLTSGFEGSSHDASPLNGEFELLRKPYRREHLAEAARRVLDRRS